MSDTIKLIYPKDEWVDFITTYENGCEVKSKNIRYLIIEDEDSSNPGYCVMTKMLIEKEIPELDHPLIFVKKIRSTKWGHLYFVERYVGVEMYHKLIYGMNAFLETKSEPTSQRWVYAGETDAIKSASL